jgi:DNA-binding NarL/FixJ family response regulator
MRVAVLSASEFRTDILKCLACGVHGYMSKGESEDEVVSGVNYISNEQIYVTFRLIYAEKNVSSRKIALQVRSCS